MFDNRMVVVRFSKRTTTITVYGVVLLVLGSSIINLLLLMLPIPTL